MALNDPSGGAVDSSDWPYLLKNYSTLPSRHTKFVPSSCGYSPTNRPMPLHLKYGVINVDKPPKPSSHEVVTWIKNILGVDKTGHSGTLDPDVTGSLIVCLSRATRLTKVHQESPKEYIAVCKLKSKSLTREDVVLALKKLEGPLFQKPPMKSAVKKVLRVRTVYTNTFLELDSERGLLLFRCSCEAGTYIRTLCEHLGLVLGVPGVMVGLRRTKTGPFTEKSVFTVQQIQEAKYALKAENSEAYLRQVVLPMEALLTHLPRVFVKDSAVNAICYGSALTITGILRYDPHLLKGSKCVFVTTKGEAIAVGVMEVSPSVIMTAKHGICAKPTRVLMDRDTYTVEWGKGPVASMKPKRTFKRSAPSKFESAKKPR